MDYQYQDIPEFITAGCSAKWQRAIVGAPASEGWVLSYVIAKDNQQIIITGTADGDDHVVDLESTDTVDWPAGQYYYYAYVTKGTTRYQWDEGVVDIRPNLIAAVDGADVLPYCFKVRDALIAVLEMRATESQTSLAVGGRQISEMSHSELWDNLNRAQTACNIWRRKDRRARGKSTGAKIKIAFTD